MLALVVFLHSVKPVFYPVESFYNSRVSFSQEFDLANQPLRNDVKLMNNIFSQVLKVLFRCCIYGNGHKIHPSLNLLLI